ncbi:MAG: hypothetical protein ACPLZY_02585 [Candidatus Norongarragalinales archaeon]
MSLEVTLTDELQKIDDAHEELKKSVKGLRDFILSPELFIDYVKFEKALSDFQDKVVTLVEITTSPQALIQQLQQAMGQKAEQQTPTPTQATLSLPSDFTVEKALICVVSVVGCGIAVEQRLLPPLTILFVVCACLALAFAQHLKGIIEAVFKKEAEKEEKITPENLEDWVNESIAQIRNQYMSARFLMKVQTQTKETLPSQFKDLGLDEALINREQYFKETLPHEFISRIERIMVACDRSIWSRKTLIVTSLVQAQAMQQRM